jgi:hypothetical protein
VLLDHTDRKLQELLNFLLGIIPEIEKGDDLPLSSRQLSDGLVDFFLKF